VNEEPSVEQCSDEGFTLVETMVAIVIVTIAMFALMAELATYLHHQALEKSRNAAVRHMTTAVETARGLKDLSALTTGSHQSTSPDGRYTTTEVVERCSATDPQGTCTTPSSSSQEVLRVRVTVSWNDNGRTRSVSTYTALGDPTKAKYSPSGSGTLSSLVGGAVSGGSPVTVSSFTSTSSVLVNTAGVPTTGISLAMQTVGLASSVTGIPITWTDDNGSHQITLTGSSNSFSGTIPASSITKVASAATTLTFAATVPNASGIPTATTTVRQAVSIGSCSVTPNPIVLTLVTRKTTLTETLACSITGLATTDSVTVSYTTGASTTTKTLTSTNGTSWSTTLAAGTSMASSGLTEPFTFTATRASDGATASNVVIAVLA
jgi:prepilin-type N-terminal cleavage/methylation domain-containing protein